MPSAVDAIRELSPASFARFAEMITRELGIKMPASKTTMVQSRLLRRVRELGLGSVEEYARYLFSSPESASERVHFINAITTNKTDFFREPDHFRYLAGTALATLAGGGRGLHARIWSAGCSSGEEPYTLAMVLSEYAASHAGFDFSIFATDVSTRVIERARAAVYSEDLIGPIAEPLRRRYLLRSRNREAKKVRIPPRLREKVSFRQLNFMDSDYRIRQMFEAIFFRNVMIYFDRATQEAVVRKLCRNLVPGGYLFVGHSESLAGLNVPLQGVHTAVFRKVG
jgi:chemotaxis protein methyltransferase CheR